MLTITTSLNHHHHHHHHHASSSSASSYAALSHVAAAAAHAISNALAQTSLSATTTTTTTIGIKDIILDTTAAAFISRHQQEQKQNAQKRVVVNNNRIMMNVCEEEDTTTSMDAITAVAAAKSDLVGNLVETTAYIIETVWPVSPASRKKSTSSNSTMDKATAVAAATIANVLEEGDVLAAVAAGDVSQVPASLRGRRRVSSASLMPLRIFVQDILRRSRASFSTLQLSLLYIVRMRNRVVSSSSNDDAATRFPTFPSMATTVTPDQRPNYACGRRMFLAALMVASKYLQDKNYSNQAWSKIAGLPLEEVNRNERKFLESIGYDLYVNQKTFAVWSSALIAKTSSLRKEAAAAAAAEKTMASPSPSVSPEVRGRRTRTSAVAIELDVIRAGAQAWIERPVSPVPSVTVANATAATAALVTERAVASMWGGKSAMVSPPISPLANGGGAGVDIQQGGQQGVVMMMTPPVVVEWGMEVDEKVGSEGGRKRKGGDVNDEEEKVIIGGDRGVGGRFGCGGLVDRGICAVRKGSKKVRVF